jgi:hypothetical protein
MYQIENKSDIFVEHYVGRIHQTYRITRIGSEQDLIKYLANGYRYLGIIDHFYERGYDDKYSNPRFSEHFFDGYGRNITATAYKNDAWNYFCKYLRNVADKDKNNYFYWHKNKTYKGTFRETPVPYTGGRRGGPSVRPRRIKHLKAMYANPEYKEFNRGSVKDVPDGWWDDWTRCRERNWKSQSKSRHQWKGDV